MSGKVVLITGGSRGIGAAIAEQAAASGYRVCITYRQAHQAAEALLDRIRMRGGQADAYQCDVADERDIVATFEAVDRDCGRLDALVNNAGVLELQSRVEHMQADRLARIFTTNVIGSFICAREAIRRMSTKQGGSGGAIVNLSSIAARLGAPNEYVDYAASKAAIDTFTIGLAKEVAGEGIRVNAVRPGVIRTEIHASGGEPNRVDRVKDSVPMLRGGEPEEVARAVLWLLSDEASYVAGSLLDVTGGR